MRLLLPAVFLALPAHAQNTSAEAGLHVTLIEPDDSGRVGEIVHHNRLTMGMQGQEFYEWETERGRIVLRLDTTINTTCDGPNAHGCPDTLTVWELPEGIYADAMEVTTAELEASVITLFLWSGM